MLSPRVTAGYCRFRLTHANAYTERANACLRHNFTTQYYSRFSLNALLLLLLLMVVSMDRASAERGAGEGQVSVFNAVIWQ